MAWCCADIFERSSGLYSGSIGLTFLCAKSAHHQFKMAATSRICAIGIIEDIRVIALLNLLEGMGKRHHIQRARREISRPVHHLHVLGELWTLQIRQSRVNGHDA